MFKFGQKKLIEKSFDDVTEKEKLQRCVVVVADAAVVDVVADFDAAVIDVVIAVDDDDVLVVAP